jgi:hypothetical protein
VYSFNWLATAVSVSASGNTHANNKHCKFISCSFPQAGKVYYWHPTTRKATYNKSEIQATPTPAAAAAAIPQAAIRVT